MIRKAAHSDIGSIMGIVGEAQRALADLGIDQWQDGYPTQDIIAEDIDTGSGYVACNEQGDVIGYAAIVLTGEQAYTQLADDSWHTPNRYVVIHRICVGKKSRRSGVANRLIDKAIEIAHTNAIYAFRIDTHSGNIRMRTLLRKRGFDYCGIVHYPSGEREAYDLNI